MLVLIDGNSILNRAFYGIMGSKMLTTPDGKYTNAVYGFLAIMFKVMDDINPDYMAVAFDLKAPTARHKMYAGYKATRHAMPEELAEQMPIIKDILKQMNITIIEKEGYEADDILGTLSKRAEKDGMKVTIVSGDRDTFQLASKNIKIRIPRTKMGKTETDIFDEDKVIETYGVTPKQMIEVKGLMGDTSDNIPGVPGVGEKTALNLIREYGSIDKLYKTMEKSPNAVKGKLKEKLIANKDLALLSKTLGTINLDVPIKEKISDFKLVEWNNEEVLETFKKLKFNRFIDRFSDRLGSETHSEIEAKDINELLQIIDIDIFNEEEIKSVIDEINKSGKLVFVIAKTEVLNSEQIVHKNIHRISIYCDEKNIVYDIKLNNEELKKNFKDIFESTKIKKYGHNLCEDYVLLKQNGITIKNMCFDAGIAGYDLNQTMGNYSIENLAELYLHIDTDQYLDQYMQDEKKNKQINLFQMDDDNSKQAEDNEKHINAFKVYLIYKLYNITIEKMKELNLIDLFENIEMPLVEILGEMQFAGMKVDKEELIEFGNKLKAQLDGIKNDIYELSGTEFNINSPKQLGEVLFEKIKLPVYKKTKNGYSTDVDVLEKLKKEHPIIEKILEYRSLTKLNSTYVEGLIPYINDKTGRIHSYFHQTITATGRISSTEPNLQNIPTREEIGKQLRKVFKPREGYIYVDADYSQIELRVLAHISQDKHMLEAFKNGEDIHKQAASKVLGIQIEEVTKEQRGKAKAVNFGIVYGISDFGLAEQIGVSRKEAKQYIEQYLEKYSGIKKFMDDIVEEAKEKGYVETLFHRRRYIPELTSKNYMVRQFGARVAMNTPIQGTAADIMKIAMIDTYNKLKKENLDAKLILQVHDELMIECKIEEKEKVKEILKTCMENATKLSIPLKAEVSEAANWYEAK